jgi:hypothetical protein
MSMCDNIEVITTLLSTHIKLLLSTINVDTLSQNVMLCEILYDIFLRQGFKIVMNLQVCSFMLSYCRLEDSYVQMIILYFVVGLKSSEYILRSDEWDMACL